MIFSPQVIWALWYLWNWPQIFRRIRKLITDLKKREKYLVFTVVCDVSSRKITFFAQKHRLSLYEQLWWNYRSFTNFDHCMNNYGQVIGLSLMNCDCELWLWLWIVNSFALGNVWIVYSSFCFSKSLWANSQKGVYKSPFPL